MRPRGQPNLHDEERSQFKAGRLMNDDAAMTFLLYLWSVLAFCTVFGLFGSWVARQKQRKELEGLILGALFGPFGVLIEALLPTLYHEKQLPATHYDVPVMSP